MRLKSGTLPHGYLVLRATIFFRPRTVMKVSDW